MEHNTRGWRIGDQGTNPRQHHTRCPTGEWGRQRSQTRPHACMHAYASIPTYIHTCHLFMEANVNEVASSFLLLQLHRIRTLSIFELEFANPPNSRKLLQECISTVPLAESKVDSRRPWQSKGNEEKQSKAEVLARMPSPRSMWTWT